MPLQHVLQPIGIGATGTVAEFSVRLQTHACVLPAEARCLQVVQENRTAYIVTEFTLPEHSRPRHINFDRFSYAIRTSLALTSISMLLHMNCQKPFAVAVVVMDMCQQRS